MLEVQAMPSSCHLLHALGVETTLFPLLFESQKGLQVMAWSKPELGKLLVFSTQLFPQELSHSVEALDQPHMMGTPN